MDERILMEKIAGGDEAALHALLRQYGPLIRYVLRPILTDRAGSGGVLCRYLPEDLADGGQL